MSEVVRVILLAGMNEMFTLPNGASQRLNCDRVKYRMPQSVFDLCKSVAEIFYGVAQRDYTSRGRN